MCILTIWLRMTSLIRHNMYLPQNIQSQGIFTEFILLPVPADFRSPFFVHLSPLNSLTFFHNMAVFQFIVYEKIELEAYATKVFNEKGFYHD